MKATYMAFKMTERMLLSNSASCYIFLLLMGTEEYRESKEELIQVENLLLQLVFPSEMLFHVPPRLLTFKIILLIFSENYLSHKCQ